MAFRSVSTELGINVAPYVDGLHNASSATRTFATEASVAGKEAGAAYEVAGKAATGYSEVAIRAQANVTAQMRKGEATQALQAEYKAIAAAAEEGSAEQIAANRLVEVSQKKLVASGLEVEAVNKESAASIASVSGMLERLGQAGGQSTGLLGQALKTVTSGASDMAMGVGISAAAVAGGLAAMTFEGVKHLVDRGAETRKLKPALGSSAEEASGLRNASIALGIDTDALSKGIFKLSTNLEKTQGDFAGVHVETARNADGTVNLVKTLDNVRAAYQSIEDPQQRNIFLQQALSKGGLELRAILSTNNQEFAKYKNSGPIVSDKDLVNTRELAISQRELSMAFQEFEIGLAKNVVPILTTAEHGLTAVAHAAGDLHLPVLQMAELGVAAVGASKGVALITGLFGTEAAAAGAAATEAEALAVAETTAGAAAAGMAAKTGLLAGAASTFASIPLAGQVVLVGGAMLMGANAADKHSSALKSVDATMIGLERHIPVVGGFLADLDAKTSGTVKSGTAQAKVTQDQAVAFADAAAALADMGVQVDDDERATATLTAAHQKAADEAKKYEETIAGLSSSVRTAYGAMSVASTEADQLASYTTAVAKAFESEDSAAKSLKQGLDILTGVHVNAEQAAITYEADIDKLTKSLTDNGNTLDIHAEKGRNNMSAVLALIGATGDLAVSMQQEGATNLQVADTYNAHIAQLREVLRQAGFTQDEIQGLIDKYHLVPEDVSTSIVTHGLPAANDGLDGLRHRLDLIDGRVVETTVFTNNVSVYHDDLSHAAGYATGGKLGTIDSGMIAFDPLLIPRAAAGFATNGPMLVGEGDPNWTEYAIATDPRYHDRNVGLWVDAGKALGMSSGIDSPIGTRQSVAGAADFDYDRLARSIVQAVGSVAGAIGGDIVVNNTIEGTVIGTDRLLAERIAEPLRAVYARRGQSAAGNYLSRG